MKNHVPILIVLILADLSILAQTQRIAPPPDERQLPRQMHSEMAHRPLITVGLKDADLIGKDNRVLQAAVDYIAGLGGGTVQILEGEYLMKDSLHLRPHVTVSGTAGKTILKKAASRESLLALDGDFGEEQITLQNSEGFEIGSGVAVWDSRAGGFHTTVGRITGKTGHTVSISMPLNADCMVQNGARAATVFPVVSGYHLEGAAVKDVVIEGNKSSNLHLNGCRGAGIFLYRGFGTVIENCVIRNYAGDGISFQQSNDVIVRDCVSEGNTHLGLHPGSGSQRPHIVNNTARNNGEDGLFLCWRVRHGLFENNLLENNGRFGISIGHKDTDNLLRHNTIRFNNRSGVYFRNESYGMAGHRNRLEGNLIENNAVSGEGAGIRIRGETEGLQFIGNIIQDTRPVDRQSQKVGVLIESEVGDVTLEKNQNKSIVKLKDQRKK